MSWFDKFMLVYILIGFIRATSGYIHILRYHPELMPNTVRWRVVAFMTSLINWPKIFLLAHRYAKQKREERKRS